MACRGVSGSEASCNKCSLEVDRNLNAYQVDSFQFMRCKAVTVHNKEVRKIHTHLRVLMSVCTCWP